MTKNIYPFFIALGSLLMGLIIGFSLTSSSAPTKTNGPSLISEVSSVSVLIDFNDGNMELFDHVPITATSTMFTVLSELNEQDMIELTYDDYGESLGVLITGVNEYSNGDDDAYWQYWVNNQYALVGVSQYALAPGDVIMWKFTKSNY